MKVDLKDLEEARDKVRWGRERRSRILDDQEKEITAYHEAGHAIMMAVQEDSEPLHKVTIIPRGASLGSTMQLPEKDRYTESKKKLLAMLVTFMGGRAAEEIVFGDITTGAQNDLKQSTNIARMMVCDWGMSPVLGPQSFGQREEHFFLGREVARNMDYSDETAQKIDNEVSRILQEAYETSKSILETNREKLDMIANLLLERETLEGYEVEEIIEHGHILTEVERAEQMGTQEDGSVVTNLDDSTASDDNVVKDADGYLPPFSGAPGPDASPA